MPGQNSVVVRLLAIDLDGTLLNSERELANENIAALRKAHDSGIEICLASGRAYFSMQPFAMELELPCHIVSANGCSLHDRQGNSLLWSPLPQQAVAELITFGQERGLPINTYSQHEVYIAEETEWSRRYLTRAKYLEPRYVGHEAMKSLETCKVLFMAEPDQITKVMSERKQSLPAVKAKEVQSETEYVEYLPLGISKATALEKLAVSLGLESAEVAAIGDFLNDAEMLRWAGTSAAMRTAHPEILEIADHTVASNDECGVAEFAEMLLSSNAGPCEPHTAR